MNPKVIIVYSITLLAGIAAGSIPSGQVVEQQNNQAYKSVKMPPGEPINESTMKTKTSERSMIPSGISMDQSVKIQQSREVQIPPGQATDQPSVQVMAPTSLPVTVAENDTPPTASVSTSNSYQEEEPHETGEETHQSTGETQAIKDEANQQIISIKNSMESNSTVEKFVSDTSLYDPYGGAPAPCPDTGLPAPLFPLPPPAYPVVDNSMPFGSSGPAPPDFGRPPQVDSLPYGPPPPVLPYYGPPAQVDSLPYGPPPPAMPDFRQNPQIDSLPYGPDVSHGFIPPDIPPAFPPAIAPVVDDCEEILPAVPPPSFGMPPPVQADSMPYGPPLTGSYPPVIPPPAGPNSLMAPLPIGYGPNFAGEDCEEDLAPLYNPSMPPPLPYAVDGFDDCEEDIPAFDTYQHDMVTIPTDLPTGTAAMDTYATALSTDTPELDTYDSDLPSESIQPAAALDILSASSETPVASEVELSSSTSTVSHSMILMLGIAFIFA